MIAYRYLARTTEGETVGGSIDATDREGAVAILRGRALFPTSIEQQRLWNRDIRLGPAGIAPRARSAFFRSFATLIRAGVPLRRALQVTIDRTNDRALKGVLREVVLEIERGDALSAALARRRAAFSPLIVAMISAGEAGGILDEVLERIATFLERDHALRQSVTSALAYPAVVLAASLALVVFLIVRIVPMFNDLFASFHVALPPSTRLLLALGNAFAEPFAWAAGLVFLLVLGLVLVRVLRTERGSLVADRLRLSVPVVGALLRKTIMARFARMLGTLVHSGVELTKALDVVVPVTASPLYSRALGRVSAALREGEALTPQLASARIFDSMLVALVGVGEETGMLDGMLEKTADYFEADVAATIATLGAIIEPALIVFLGVIVGFIVSSVFIPLYSLIGSVSK